MKCPKCKGEKFIEAAIYDDHGYIMYDKQRCPVCRGKGSVEDESGTNDD